MELSADALADARIRGAADGTGRAVRGLTMAYLEWADVGAGLEMISGGQGGLIRGLTEAVEGGAALPAEAVARAAEAQGDYRRMLDRAARRIKGLGPDEAQAPWHELAAAQIPRIAAAMDDATKTIPDDIEESMTFARDAHFGLRHLVDDWEFQKQAAGKLARGLSQRERDLARAVASADPFALGGSGPSVDKRFRMQARRIGYLEAILRKEVLSEAPENATEEQSKALEQRLASLDARRRTASRAHEDGRKAFEADGWPPSQAVVDGIDGARGALRDLWLSLATFEDALEAAGEEQEAAAAVSAGAASGLEGDDVDLPEQARTPPFLLSDQAKEQDLVVGLARRLVDRLPQELAVANARKPGDGVEDPTPEQVESAQLSIAYGVIADLLSNARTQASKASATLHPANTPEKTKALGELLARANPAQTEAAELFAQALEELRRARLGLGAVAHNVMRMEGVLLPLARDIAAGVEVKRGDDAATVKDLSEAQDGLVAPMIARVPAALERTLAQLRPRGGEGKEPTEDELRQFEQSKMTLESMAGQLEAAHKRASEMFAAGDVVAGRGAVDMAWQVARQLWVGFADLQKLLEEGIREETGLIARSSEFQSATEGVPDVRRDGAVADQTRTKALVPRMVEAVRHQGGEGGGGGQQGGGLPEEVVALAEKNLPLAEAAMQEAETGLAEGRWSAARTQQEKAKRLLEEILEKLQDSQEKDDQEQQQPQPQQQPEDQQQSPEERKRQQRAVAERNKKMRDGADRTRKRPPVEEDW